MNVLQQIGEVIARLKSRGATDGEILAAIKAFIHSPVVALLVGATPNKTDDAILEVLKTLFPV